MLWWSLELNVWPETLVPVLRWLHRAIIFFGGERGQDPFCRVTRFIDGPFFFNSVFFEWKVYFCFTFKFECYKIYSLWYMVLTNAELYIYHDNQHAQSPITSKILFKLHVKNAPPHLQPLATTGLFSILEFCLFLYMLYRESTESSLFGFDFYHLGKCLWDSFVLFHISLDYSFLLQSSIPLYRCTTVC